MTELTGAVWRTSSRSNDQGLCVEVATNLPGVVAVRDSKDRSGPVLAFTPSEWSAFIAGVKNGKFDCDTLRHRDLLQRAQEAMAETSDFVEYGEDDLEELLRS